LVDLSDSEVRIDLWKTLKDQRSAIKICKINEHEQARALISCGQISVGQLRGPESSSGFCSAAIARVKQIVNSESLTPTAK
jgi:hypothetical protein